MSNTKYKYTIGDEVVINDKYHLILEYKKDTDTYDVEDLKGNTSEFYPGTEDEWIARS